MRPGSIAAIFRHLQPWLATALRIASSSAALQSLRSATGAHASGWTTTPGDASAAAAIAAADGGGSGAQSAGGGLKTSRSPRMSPSPSLSPSVSPSAS